MWSYIIGFSHSDNRQLFCPYRIRFKPRDVSKFRIKKLEGVKYFFNFKGFDEFEILEVYQIILIEILFKYLLFL